MRRVAIAAAFVVALAKAAAAQTDVSALVDRASAYVERFQQSFGSVVSEERYEQKLRRIPNPTNTSVQQRGGGGPAETTLVSDFLLVEVTGEGWLPFRDVFERDGKPVRDREQRLAAIFLKGGRDAFEQARAVMDEGARLQHRKHQPKHQHAHVTVSLPDRASSPPFRVQARQARRVRSRRRDRIPRDRAPHLRRDHRRPRPAGSRTLLDRRRRRYRPTHRVGRGRYRRRSPHHRDLPEGRGH